jgi:hypothetical protein
VENKKEAEVRERCMVWDLGDLIKKILPPLANSKMDEKKAGNLAKMLNYAP